MFEQPQIAVERLPTPERASFFERLDQLRLAAGQLGLAVKDAFDTLVLENGLSWIMNHVMTAITSPPETR